MQKRVFAWIIAALVCLNVFTCGYLALHMFLNGIEQHGCCARFADGDYRVIVTETRAIVPPGTHKVQITIYDDNKEHFKRTPASFFTTVAKDGNLTADDFHCETTDEYVEVSLLNPDHQMERYRFYYEDYKEAAT